MLGCLAVICGLAVTRGLTVMGVLSVLGGFTAAIFWLCDEKAVCKSVSFNPQTLPVMPPPFTLPVKCMISLFLSYLQ